MTKSFKFLIAITLAVLCSSFTFCTPEDCDGIEVNERHGNIDWRIFWRAGSNVRYVYMHATSGDSLVDSTYLHNLEGAHGTYMVGSYHTFSPAVSARRQFRHLSRHIVDSMQHLVPMVKVEPIGDFPVEQARGNLRQLLRLIERHYGAKPMIGATMDVWDTVLSHGFDGYKAYVTHVADSAPARDYFIWQYADMKRYYGYGRLNPNDSLEEIIIHERPRNKGSVPNPPQKKSSNT